MAHRGVLRCVSLLHSVSFLVSFFLVETEWHGIHVWYSPALVQSRLASQTFSHLCLAWFLALTGLWTVGHPCFVLTRLLHFDLLFFGVAFCRFAPLYYTGLSLTVFRKLCCPFFRGAKCLFSARVLCSEQSSSGYRIKFVSCFSSSEQGCEESLCLHEGRSLAVISPAVEADIFWKCLFESLIMYAHWPSSDTAVMKTKTYLRDKRVTEPLSFFFFLSFVFLVGVEVISLFHFCKEGLLH